MGTAQECSSLQKNVFYIVGDLFLTFFCQESDEMINTMKAD